MAIPFISDRKHPQRWLIGLTTTALILGGTATYAILSNQSDTSSLDTLTRTVQQQDLTLRIPGDGLVVPIQQVNISPKNSGRLNQLFVDEGDRVEKGQRIALMDNDTVQAQFRQATASLEQAQARLAQAQAGSRSEEIEQAKARLRQAEARLAQAQARLPQEIQQAQAAVAAAQSRFELAANRKNRYQSLFEDGAVSRDRYEEALNEFRNAQANLAEAQDRLEQRQRTDTPEIQQLQAAVREAQQGLQLLEKGPRIEEIQQLEAAVAEAQGRVEDIAIQLNDTILTAPFSGLVTQKNAEEGDFVAPTLGASNTSIVEIAQGMKVTVKVPEVDVVFIEPGQSVEIIAQAYPDQVFQGRVKRVSPRAQEEQDVTTFEVEVALETGEDQLRYGMNVDATFLGQELSQTLVVPTVAIVTQEGETGVLIPDEQGKPQFQPVTIGITVDNQTQIVEGVEAGDQVFLELPEGSRFQEDD